MKFSVITALLLASIPVPGIAETVSDIAIVPKGMHVDSFFPPCGISVSLPEAIGSKPEITTAIGNSFGPEAASVVLAVTVGDQMAKEHGGVLGDLWNKGTKRKDGSSCATFCLRSPNNVTPTKVILSNRHGQDATSYDFKDGVIVQAISPTQDWSGWRDIVSAKANDRHLVCGTAANWSAEESATMRMALEYAPGSRAATPQISTPQVAVNCPQETASRFLRACDEGRGADVRSILGSQSGCVNYQDNIGVSCLYAAALGCDEKDKSGNLKSMIDVTKAALEKQAAPSLSIKDGYQVTAERPRGNNAGWTPLSAVQYRLKKGPGGPQCEQIKSLLLERGATDTAAYPY